jgi:hypothetical protein
MMLVEKGSRVASMSQENEPRGGWSLGLFFDYHGGDYPQPMLSLVSPYELNKSGRDILSPCVRLSRIALSFIV